MRKLYICIGATLSYWISLMLIPVAVMLINDFGYQYSGFGWTEGEVFYNILSTLKQSLACFAGFAAMQYICGEYAPWCPFVNASFSSLFFLLLTFCAGSVWEVVEMGLSAAMCIASFYMQRNEIIRIAYERAGKDNCNEEMR